MSEEAPIEVYAVDRPGRVDPATVAYFANSNRAESYAQTLVKDNTYTGVFVVDADGKTWPIEGSTTT